MQLKPNTLLQGGRYRIIRVLGQGGFGITYEARHDKLDVVFAIKEFFMKDCCERDTATSQVSVGSSGMKGLVDKFRGKFIREAQMMRKLDHPHIVRVTDCFEENGTAYYVMDYLSGGSLSDKIKKDGPLSEAQAGKYIRQVADALAYIHSGNTAHLDVKPSNILLNAKGEAVLVDFGISKHYDNAGEQTSSTPVGLSKGFSPLEQGRDGDVSQFGPSTDIYALGATLYNMVTGKVPPEAAIVNEDGLDRPKGISDHIWHVIETSMQPRRKDRPQSIAEFLQLLDGQSDDVKGDRDKTVVKGHHGTGPVPDGGGRKSKTWLWGILAAIAVAAIALAALLGGKRQDGSVSSTADTLSVGTSQIDSLSSTDPVPPGSLKVASTPSGASIWLDGKNTKKTTPEILEELDPGQHSIRLVLDGYGDYSGKVTVSSGKRTDLARTLTANELIPSPPPAKPDGSRSTSDDSKTIAPTPASASNRENGHEWVDLGLSVKWATCNVGATSPSDYGRYFPWGETSPRNDSSWETLRYCADDSGDSFTKYNTQLDYGSIDNKTRLELSDDAARANWGGKWRMPTSTEWQELVSKCSWSWTNQGGKNGYKVTGKNGNSIFLVAAGDRYEDQQGFIGSNGYYWSSSLDKERPHNAWFLFFKSDNYYVNNSLRFLGFSVRPVLD